jgi:hypothetical protein
MRVKEIPTVGFFQNTTSLRFSLQYLPWIFYQVSTLFFTVFYSMHFSGRQRIFSSDVCFALLIIDKCFSNF